MKTLIGYLVTLLLLSLAAPAFADNQPLFESDDILSIKIEAPLNTLFSKLRDAGEEVEGTMTVVSTTHGTEVFDIKLEPRGKTRRDKKVCRFPPLTVNFKKKAAKGTLFHKQDKLKLVTHCQSKRASYDLYYLQEYLVYKAYNIVTEESFRVRLATIDYVDTEGKQSVVGKYGFFIEDADRLAKRLGRERRKIDRVLRTEYEPAASARVAMFQYFIGNLDWAILGGPEGENCCHNAKPLFAANGQAIPVPYDFDYAGVINAKYAVPPSSLPVKSVRTRLYRGFCDHNNELTAVAARFQEKKPEIYALINGSQLLPERTIKSTRKYYDDFYKTLDDPARVEKYLIKKCR